MYVVLEIQTMADGVIGTIINTYKTRENAESKYHEILMYAATSSVPIHAASMLDNNGRYIKNESFNHTDGYDIEE